MELRKTVCAALVACLLFCSLSGWAAGKEVFRGSVNINTATVDELTLLPGIGPAKARTIVEYREKSPFKSPEEIENVKGIGEKLFEKLKPMLRTSGASVSMDENSPSATAKTN